MPDAATSLPLMNEALTLLEHPAISQPLTDCFSARAKQRSWVFLERTDESPACPGQP
jgi:hypothetical protein